MIFCPPHVLLIWNFLCSGATTKAQYLLATIRKPRDVITCNGESLGALVGQLKRISKQGKEFYRRITWKTCKCVYYTSEACVSHGHGSLSIMRGNKQPGPVTQCDTVWQVTGGTGDKHVTWGERGQLAGIKRANNIPSVQILLRLRLSLSLGQFLSS